MTKEQYEETNKYRGIIDLFIKTGEYIGGIGNLVIYWDSITGEKTNTSCPSCMAAFLISMNEKTKNYELNLQGL